MSIPENLRRVMESVRDAELKAGREPHSVQLLAVSKFNPKESVEKAVEAGQLLFGENRVQEACGKFEALKASVPQIRLHMIGSLQRNKVKQLLPIVECVQSVDRLELLVEIEKRAAELGKTLDILLEFHTGEESKAGFPDTDTLFRALDYFPNLSHITCRGLMTMAPWSSDAQTVRSSFKTLANLRETCISRYPGMDFSVLSMGMSGDYRIAIEEGSTLVRIGTAIFGDRS